MSRPEAGQDSERGAPPPSPRRLQRSRSEGSAKRPPDWLVDFDQSSEATALDRLAADQEVLLQLQLEGYEGEAWLYFREVLARYGFAVLRAWIYKGKIVERCLEKGIRRGLPRGADAGPLGRDAADELGGETVAVAINAFRDEVLKKNRWDPSRGPGRTASLKTFFIGQCLIRYPEVFRRWKREQGTDRPGLPPDADFGQVEGVEATVVQRDELETAAKTVDSRTFRVLELRSMGFPHAEIASMLGDGTSPKGVEMLLYRHEQRLKRKRDQGG